MTTPVTEFNVGSAAAGTTADGNMIDGTMVDGIRGGAMADQARVPRFMPQALNSDLYGYGE